ncbi:MAG TPA: hypothetical protein VIZ22_10495 [Candidatus Limnocylindrales bacterium]
MSRRVPAILLVLVALAGCAPADAVEPPRLAVVTDVPATPVATPLDAPTARLTAEPAPATEPPATSEAPASPQPGATPEPSATPEPVVGHDTGGIKPSAAMSVNLAQTADFVPQYTFEWCVGASLQMTRSIITGDRNETRRSQGRLWRMARERTLNSPYGGVNPIGWTAALNDMGLGPYRFVSLPTFDAALTAAARAIAVTRRPVGLVMWAGRHAWVMTGFESDGNPRKDDNARVTRIRVMDPLYPHGSRWGRSPAPNTLVSRKTLARQFVLRYRPDYDLGIEPGWLLILPVR